MKAPTKSFDEAVWLDWKTTFTLAPDGRTQIVHEPAKKKRLESKLIFDNTPLIRHLVLKQARCMRLNYDQDELMQCGYIAFLRALGKHNPAKGQNGKPSRFSTILAWWVRHEISHCLVKSEEMPKPRDYHMPMVVRAAIEKFERKEGREPSLAEINEMEAYDEPISEGTLRVWKEPASLLLSFDYTKKSQDEMLTMHETMSDDEPDAGDRLIEAQRRAMADDAILCLDDETKQMVSLWAEGLDFKKIARQVKKPVDFVEAQVNEALSFMRKRCTGY